MENKKLSSEEIDELLNEVASEEVEAPKRTTEKKKVSRFSRTVGNKKPIRIDIIISIVVLAIAIVIIGKNVTSCVKNAPSSSESDNPLLNDKYPEITDVVGHYLRAFLIADPTKRQEELARYVDNLGDISANDVAQNKVVTSYDQIETYTKKGPYKDTYVVYAYYQTTYKNIAQSAPSVKTLYVIRDSKSGDVYVHNGRNAELTEYIAKVSRDDDVQNLFEETNKEYQEALAKSPRLRDFFDKLQKLSQAKEQATNAGTTAKAGATTKSAATSKAAATTKK